MSIRYVGISGRLAPLSVILAGMALLACLAGPAYAVDQCAALGGTLVPAVPPNECQITTAVSKSGSFTLDETLRITDAGKITVPAAAGGNTLSLKITGSLIMDDGAAAGAAKIVGDATGASAVGATISVDATGDIQLHGTGATGASITSNQSAGSCVSGSGGNIFLTAGGEIITDPGTVIKSSSPCGKGEIDLLADTSITLGGQILSEGTTTVGRGGPISVKAGCTLTVNNSATVVSQGRDPGADLVHLQAGCDVLIEGRVASTGPGHVSPPANLCHGPNRPDKPADAAACVEVWAGSTITVDATPGHNGEISADTSMSGGVLCCPWIDLYAQGDISIKGDTTAPFAVHANETLTNAFGGLITVKSKGGNVSASGLAIQANATASGGTGGNVVVQAKNDVTLNDAQIFAKGDAVATGGFGNGGSVEARAFSGGLFWKDLPAGVVATGDVQPTGTTIPLAKRGSVTLEFCGLNDTAGTLFPVTAGSPTTPTITGALCPPPEAPELPAYVVLPECVCAPFPPHDVSVVKSTHSPSVQAGTPISYSITVSATGSANSDNVTLTDTLPSGPGALSWTVGGANAAACSPASPVAGGTALTCNFGTMAPGTSKTITLTSPTTTANCGTVNNTATVTADADINPANNSSGPIGINVTCPVLPADVSVVKTAHSPNIVLGQPPFATFLIKVTANGPGSSNDVVLTDVLPNLTGSKSATLTWTVSSPGTSDATFCTASPITGGNTLTCNFGTMAAGTSRNIRVTAPTDTSVCPAAHAFVVNTVSVTSSNDSNPANNTSGPVTINASCP